jgi:dTMP kinase
MEKSKSERIIEDRTKQGVLIVFEGIDGSGKTTQAVRCYERLRGQEFPVALLREPTDGRYGRIIRGILSGQIPRKIPSKELQLFMMDREEDVSLNIQPALHRGEIVLLDRYYYSTIAYQGAMGIDPEWIRAQNESFCPQPHLVFIFLVTVEKGLERIRKKRANGEDYYEKDEFLRKVDRLFRALRDTQIRFIESERRLSEVNEEVDSIIDVFLSEKGYQR